MTARPCSVEGCTSPAHARGWCSAHYQRWRHSGDIGTAPVKERRSVCVIEGCGRRHRSRGYCERHYDRWQRWGDPLFSFHATPEERFWSNVDRRGADECWPWIGRLNGKGYGVFSINKRTTQPHRFAYEQLVEPIPAGLVIDHLCHDEDPDCVGNECPHRRCCNPSHMEPVTPQENFRRGHQDAWRVRYLATITHCPQGHPYDDENTYVSKAGSRTCRACARLRSREDYWRKKAQQHQAAEA